MSSAGVWSVPMPNLLVAWLFGVVCPPLPRPGRPGTASVQVEERDLRGAVFVGDAHQNVVAGPEVGEAVRARSQTGTAVHREGLGPGDGTGHVGARQVDGEVEDAH